MRTRATMGFRTFWSVALSMGACVVLFGSCVVDDPAAERAAVGGASCVSRDQDCKDTDCPDGTVCALVRDVGAGGVADTASGGASPFVRRPGALVPRCRVPLSQSASTAALVRQFGVDDFPLVRADDSNVFQFEAKASASIVVCALFDCTPLIRDRSLQNGDSCVIAKKLFTQQKGSFDLSDPLLLRHVTKTVEFCDDGQPLSDPASPSRGVTSALPEHAPYLTHLSVGCWAYDDVALVGATLLVPVRADASVESSFGLRANCEPRVVETALSDTPIMQSVDGANCTLPATDMVGTCSGGFCRQRCLDDVDCGSPKRLGVAAPECPSPSLDQGGEAGNGSNGAGGAGGAGSAGGAGGAGYVNRQLPLSPMVCEHPFKGAIGQCIRRCEAGQ